MGIRTRTLKTLGIALVVLSCSAVHGVAQQTTDSRTLEEIVQVVKGLDGAGAAQDAAAYARLWAEDVTVVTPEGRLLRRAEALATVDPAAMKGLTASPSEDVQIRVYGNTAVVTGRITISGQQNGKTVNDQLRFTDTLVKRDGRWLLVADHVTLVAK